jgi:hypothetical protein
VRDVTERDDVKRRRLAAACGKYLNVFAQILKFYPAAWLY